MHHDLIEALKTPGRGKAVFVDTEGNAERPIEVHTYRSAGFTSKDPVIFTLHGMNRNGSDYRDFWVDSAEANNALVVAPTYASEYYPDRPGYNNGLVVDTETSAIAPKEKWAYFSLDRLFCILQDRKVTEREAGWLYGHSAGGQFSHRAVLVGATTKFERVMSSNSGWYTLPGFQKRFPSGLDGLGFDDDHLRDVLSRPLTILAGQEDNKQDASLPLYPDAIAQGPNRYARACNFLRAARMEAKRLDVELAWLMESVPFIGHDGNAMTQVAASLWFEEQFPELSTLEQLAGGKHR